MPGNGSVGTLTSADIGARLRRMREAKGISAEEMASTVFKCSQSYFSKLERGVKEMTPDMRRTAEWVLAIADDGHSMASVPYISLEQSAGQLRSWEPDAVPGACQIEGYSRCVLAAASPGISPSALDQAVALRARRQEIWDREDPPPPMLAVVIGESALRRLTGSREVMRAQMERLAEMASHPRVSIQVLPFDAGGSVRLVCPFVIASFADPSRPDAAYLDDTLAGRTTDKHATVAQLGLPFDALAREALRPRESLTMITEAAARWN